MTTDLRDASHALTVTEAAARLGVSSRTLKRWRATDLAYFRVGPRGDRRYKPQDIDAYIARRTFGL